MSQLLYRALSDSATHNVLIKGFQIHKLAVTLAMKLNIPISSHAGTSLIQVNIILSTIDFELVLNFVISTNSFA